MNSNPNRESTEVPATGAMPPQQPTLTAPEPTEYGMSPQQPNAAPAATRPRRERALIVVCAAVTAAAVLGIVLMLAGDDEPTATVPAPTAPGTTEPAASSPAAATPADIAAEEAKARYLNFVSVTDQVAQGGYADPLLYEMVAIDPLATQLQLAARRKPAGQRSTGNIQVVSLTVQSVELSKTPQTYSAVRLLACLDVSGTDVLDSSGKSVTPADRLPRVKSSALLQKIPTTAFAASDRRPTDWYVSELDQRGEAC